MKLQKNYRLKNEQQTYPELKKYFERKGYIYSRIEANPTIPDIHIMKSNKWYWTEVKILRSQKELFSAITADDLSWQPGQLKFRKDMIDVGLGDHYLLVVVTLDWEFRFIIGGLDRK